MIFGDLFLAFTRIRFHTANGVAFGNAAHGFGTSRAGQRHETEGVMASLTMIFGRTVYGIILARPWCIW